MVIVQGNYEEIICYCKNTLGDFFEFEFSYVDNTEHFRELDRFLWESKHCLRFQNEFTGNAVIDLSSWNTKDLYEFNDYFDAFMYYIRSKAISLKVTFIVSTKCSENLYKTLSKHFELQLIEPEKGEVKFKFPFPKETPKQDESKRHRPNCRNSKGDASYNNDHFLNEDIQKCLEAKIDELFGSDDDND